jgi:hypothetical protein
MNVSIWTLIMEEVGEDRHLSLHTSMAAAEGALLSYIENRWNLKKAFPNDRVEAVRAYFGVNEDQDYEINHQLVELKAPAAGGEVIGDEVILNENEVAVILEALLCAGPEAVAIRTFGGDSKTAEMHMSRAFAKLKD